MANKQIVFILKVEYNSKINLTIIKSMNKIENPDNIISSSAENEPRLDAQKVKQLLLDVTNILSKGMEIIDEPTGKEKALQDIIREAIIKIDQISFDKRGEFRTDDLV